MGLDISLNLRNRASSEIAYFRKVNFLVRFMESYYGKEVENCIPFEINKDGIVELKDRCEKVLKDHTLAKELLPTQEGFFFGNTEYNDAYYKDVALVLEKCDEILECFDELQPDEYITFDIWY